jgi:hypothetical protein
VNAKNARQKITIFRARYPKSLEWSYRARASLKPTVDSLYRECQEFATGQIRKTVDEAFSRLSGDIGQYAPQERSTNISVDGQ